jgi:hypothetical protein
MQRLLLLLLLAFPVWAQVADEAQPEATEDSSAAGTDTAEESVDESPDFDEDLDELYSDEDEDAFIPSEDVKFGQSIPFPTDI